MGSLQTPQALADALPQEVGAQHQVDSARKLAAQQALCRPVRVALAHCPAHKPARLTCTASRATMGERRKPVASRSTPTPTSENASRPAPTEAHRAPPKVQPQSPSACALCADVLKLGRKRAAQPTMHISAQRGTCKGAHGNARVSTAMRK